MKILYDHTVFQFQKYGGISRYFYNLMWVLSSIDGVNINLFQGVHINEYDIKNCINRSHSYCGYKWSYKIPPAKYLTHLLAPPNRLIFNNIYTFNKDYDIYHPTYYSSYLKKIKGAATVLTVHDMIHELYSEMFRDSKSVIKAKKKSIDSADLLICVSENTRKDLIDIYDVPDDKIKVVYHGNSLSKHANYWSREEISLRFGINRPFILYVGDRKGYKSFMFLLDAYLTSLCNNFDLVCFGGGAFNSLEMEKIYEKKVANKVFHLSGSDIVLGSLYKNAFCFVCPSLYEGFGIPLIEAMGLGCPVVASNTSSIPEVVGKAALLFDPHSKDSLIDSIEHLSNYKKRIQLIESGLDQEKKYGLEKTAAETLDAYTYARHNIS